MTYDELTDREYDVLEGLAAGETNAEIAERLVLSVETVRWYSKQIYSKLGVSNRTQAGLKAQELGLLENDALQNESTETAPPRYGLPQYYSSFVGRQAEINDIATLLTKPDVRLLSIVGPGGAGKTRLAVEVARHIAADFTDGVVFIPVDAAMTDEESLLLALHRALDIGTVEGILDALSEYHALFIFDNFEQSLDQTAVITQLLSACPDITILVTSQVSLNLSAEWVRRIGNLSSEDEAIQLFMDRVTQVMEGFTLSNHTDCVTEICRLVHGSPLAIELVAAWLKTVTCTDILTELRASPDILSAAADDITARHRSLEAVFEHTWNLLPDEERRIFKRLAVFRGEFGLPAARQVAGASLNTLSTLVDWSLIYRTQNGLYQIHGLLRHYAEQKLIGQQHGLQSNMAFAMIALMKGEFDRVEEVAETLLNQSSDEVNVDKGFALAMLGVIAGAQEDYVHCQQMCEASLTITQDNPLASYFSQLGLSIAYLGTDDGISAKVALKRAAEAAHTLQSTAFIVLYLPVLAILKYKHEEYEQSTHMYSLAMHHSDILPDWMLAWPLVRDLKITLQQALSTSSFDEHWQKGQMIDPQSIVVG